MPFRLQGVTCATCTTSNPRLTQSLNSRCWELDFWKPGPPLGQRHLVKHVALTDQTIHGDTQTVQRPAEQKPTNDPPAFLAHHETTTRGAVRVLA